MTPLTDIELAQQGDYEAAHRLLDVVEAQSLQDAFLGVIDRDLTLPYPKGRMPPILWAYLRATPQQIARAFAKVMGT